MAEFKGFVCDDCGDVWVDDSKTRVKITFTGHSKLGSFYRELCPNCIIEPEGARPTLKRNRKSGSAAETNQENAD